MLVFTVHNIKIKLSFSFFAMIALIALIQNATLYMLVIALSCCLIHESGHLIFMAVFSQLPDEITFYGGGIKINNTACISIPKRNELLILLGGSAINIIIALISIVITKRAGYFASANLFFAIFNLIPVGYFDGGRIVSLLLGESKANKLISFMFILIFAIVLIFMLLGGVNSLSLILTFAYVLFAEFVV